MRGALLRRVSLAATLGQTSYAEWSAGIAAHQPVWHPAGAARPGVSLALLLPLSIDAYVVYALETRGGSARFRALGLLAASVITGSLHAAATLREGVTAAALGLVLVAVLFELYSDRAPEIEVADPIGSADRIGSAPDPIGAADPISDPITPDPIDPIRSTPHPIDRPDRSTRSDRDRVPDPIADPIRSKRRSTRSTRSIGELRIGLREAIESGALPRQPSADRIRLHLSCSPSRARQLRDELQREAS